MIRLILKGNVLFPTGKREETTNSEGRLYPSTAISVTRGPASGLRGRVLRYVEDRLGEPHYVVEFTDVDAVLDGYRRMVLNVLAEGELNKEDAARVLTEALGRLQR